jgi:hypothetical protein
MNQWNNIPIKEPKSIRTPKSYDIIEIAKWAYIVELESFVLIDNPLKTLRNKDQFNDSFPHLKIPNCSWAHHSIPINFPCSFIKGIQRILGRAQFG